MPPRLTRPAIRRAGAASRTPPEIVQLARRAKRPVAAATSTSPLVPRGALRVPKVRPMLPVPVATSHRPRPAAPSRLTGWQGPNPYGDFARSFTDAGGIRLTFKIRDTQLWRTVIRAILWLLLVAATLWFAGHASPYPLVPRGCGIVRNCPAGLVATHILVNVLLVGLLAGLGCWILFFQDQTLASIEIRPDCMIVDDADLFWRDRMDLGWPQLTPLPDGSTVLRGVYGTREIDYVTLHAFDEQDRAIQVLGLHLQAAMQQLWSAPG